MPEKSRGTTGAHPLPKIAPPRPSSRSRRRLRADPLRRRPRRQHRNVTRTNGAGEFAYIRRCIAVAEGWPNIRCDLRCLRYDGAVAMRVSHLAHSDNPTAASWLHRQLRAGHGIMVHEQAIQRQDLRVLWWGAVDEDRRSCLRTRVFHQCAARKSSEGSGLRGLQS